MKNVFKVLGIIALVAVIGFSMASCKDGDGGGDSTLKIKNNYDSPITHVRVAASSGALVDEDVTIAASGGTWSKSFSFSETASLSVTVSASGLSGGTATKGFTLPRGETRTLTLDTTGQLDVD